MLGNRNVNELSGGGKIVVFPTKIYNIFLAAGTFTCLWCHITPWQMHSKLWKMAGQT